ncbi:hypothetical protein DIPPA_50499, partial [Diplonema papillatum]
MAAIDAINTSITHLATGLILASYQGHVDVVKRLLRTRRAHVAVDSTNNCGHTALMLTSEKGHVTLVKELLSAGANVNAADNDGDTALIGASRQGHKSLV